MTLLHEPATSASHDSTGTFHDHVAGETLFVRHDWWDRASCRDPDAVLAGLFFSDELQDIAAAKRICATCPVLPDCLEGAIDRREPWGVWGGQLFLNGKVLASKRRRGRPPKEPRPEDQLPEIPVPSHLQPHLRTA